MTKAKKQFDKSIKRCEELLKLDANIKSAQSAGKLDVQPSNDVLRAAIVIAVAAFDAYATDCFAEKFVVYIKHNSVDGSLEKLLLDSGFTIKFALSLLDSDRPYRKIRTLINRYYAKYTTQKLGVIDELFLQYHIKDITKNAAKRSGKNVDRLLGSVNKIIERRHNIVHDGDYNIHGKIKPVRETDISRISDLKILVDNMDYIIENRCERRS